MRKQYLTVFFTLSFHTSIDQSGSPLSVCPLPGAVGRDLCLCFASPRGGLGLERPRQISAMCGGFGDHGFSILRGVEQKKKKEGTAARRAQAAFEPHL